MNVIEVQHLQDCAASKEGDAFMHLRILRPMGQVQKGSAAVKSLYMFWCWLLRTFACCLRQYEAACAKNCFKIP